VRRYLHSILHALAWCALLLPPSGPAHAFACLTTTTNGPCLHWTQGGATLDSFLMNTIWDMDAVSDANAWNAVGAAFHFTVNVGGALNEPCGAAGPAHACANSGPVNDNPVVFRSSFCGQSFQDIIELTNNCFDPNSGAMFTAPVFVNSTVPWSSYDGPIMFGTNGQAINDIKRVLLHEFGHVLGLDHPDDHGQNVAAIMNSHESDLYQLQPDDIAGIKFLYPNNASSGSNGATSSNVNSCQIGEPGRPQHAWILWWLPALLGICVRRRLSTQHSAPSTQD